MRTSVFPLVLAHSESTLPYLPLGMLLAHARSFDGGRLGVYYEFEALMLGGVDGYPLEPIYSAISHASQPLCLFSSYVWNHDINLEVAARVKALKPDSLIVFGGPEVPKYQGDTEKFFELYPFVDIAVLGEGESSFVEILDSLISPTGIATDLRLDVAGIVYRSGSSIIRTRDRERIKDVNAIPSPYLSGEMGEWFYDFSNTTIETNRGCPYGCTYCDWGSATLQKVSKFSVARVAAEIEFVAARRSKTIFIADANFGMLEQDIAIAEALVAVRKRTGFPQKVNTNFAKNGGRRLMQVIKVLHEGGLLPVGIIALQSTDQKVLETIQRDNIKTSNYEKMMEYFNAENIPMSTDIMIGLPGQTYESLVADIQYCFDWKLSANGNLTSMMPNAPMAERNYREKHEIQADDNGLIVSTSTFTAGDMRRMKSIFFVYQFLVRLSVFRYALYYLQLQHQLKVAEFLCSWLDCVENGDARLPISKRVFDEMIAIDTRNSDWVLMSWNEDALFFFQDTENFYRELFDFIADEFSIVIPTSSQSTLISAHQAVMPKMGREYPYRITLKHDLVAYFDQVRKVANLRQLGDSFIALESFPEAVLEVTPPYKQKRKIQFIKVSGHMDDWELPSPLRFY